MGGSSFCWRTSSTRGNGARRMNSLEDSGFTSKTPRGRPSRKALTAARRGCFTFAQKYLSSSRGPTLRKALQAIEKSRTRGLLEEGEVARGKERKGKNKSNHFRDCIS